MNAHFSLIYGDLDAPSTRPQKEQALKPTATTHQNQEETKDSKSFPITNSTAAPSTQAPGSTLTSATAANQPASSAQQTAAPSLMNNPKRKKKILRKAAGKTWEDQTLDEWPDNDYRIFCGDLGNEVNDEVLANAFKRYPSFVKARVVRDKVTLKSKGYGFVSVMNQDDYIRAMREMNGKYVGNRPIRLKKSDWQDKSAIGGTGGSGSGGLRQKYEQILLGKRK